MARIKVECIGIFLFISFSVSAQYEGKTGINLGNVHSEAYVNMVRGARPFDKGSAQSPIEPGEMDENGWPNRDFRLFLMDNRPVAEWNNEIDDPESYRVDYSGIYKSSFKGSAEIANIAGPWHIENQNYDTAVNTTTFDLIIDEPGPNHGLVIMGFTDTRRHADSMVNTGISDLKIIRPGYEERQDQFYTDHFIDALTSADFSTIRSQNLLGTTGWDIIYPEEHEWDQRKLPGDPIQANPYHQKRESIAWEHFIDLCNRVAMDMWINIPISASEDYVTNLAQLIKDNLDPGLNVYVENDNEVWNSAPAFIGTYEYNADESVFHNITEQENIARRTVELSGLFASVFGQEEINNRVRVVLASHAPMVKWWVTPMLNYINDNFDPPKNYIYAISRQTYFSSENAEQLSADQIIDECYKNINEQLEGEEINESGRADWIKVASEWELPGGANSYEGGPHIPSGGSTVNIENQIRMHRSERMIRLLRYNIVNNWYDLGGDLAMHFTLFGGYNRYGCWGITDDLHFPDRNYKMEAFRDPHTVTAFRNPHENKKEITLYPNPAARKVKIKLPDNRKAAIEVTDLNGKILFRTEDIKSDGVFSLDHLATGMYLVKIILPNKLITKRILIE